LFKLAILSGCVSAYDTGRREIQ